MIDVCCAVISNTQGLIFVTQRSARMSLPLCWEFPGGKLEKGESEEDCLKRELKEELNIEVEIHERLGEFVHEYNEFSINLIAFDCTTAASDQEIKLVEHAQFRWMRLEQLGELDWAAADLPVVALLQSMRRS